MSDRRSSAELGSSAEAVLSNMPFPERDWDSSARAVEARLSDSVRGTTDDALLAAPLPSEAGEPSAFSATTTPLTNSGVRTQSLAELARRSVEKKHAGEREVARASLAIAAKQRPSAEEARALREAVSQRAVPAPPPSAPSAVRPVVSAAAAPLIASAPAAPRSNLLPKLAIATSALAIAAVALLWLRQPATEPLAGARIAPQAASTAEQPSSANAARRAAEPAAPLATGIDPSTLPGESATTKPAATPEAHAKLQAAPSSGPSSKPSGERVDLQDDPVEAAPAPVAQAAPGEKPVEKSLPPDPALRPADSNTGAMPVKPSTGAVQAALGSVMSGARHCVAGDDAPSSAVVLFGSDGRVQSVSVSGPAAGKASGTCIQAQLGRARVQPFAQATFSVNATVRPD